MKILGIDFGTKRIGIAISDEEGKVAFPKKVFARTGSIVKDIEAYAKTEHVTVIVIGMPKNVSETWQDDIKKFSNTLTADGFEVILQDESFSSHEAHQTAHSFGLTLEETDASAAALILQRYLDKESHKA